MTIGNDIYQKRKKIEEEKLVALEAYISSNKCRSKQISDYFGSPSERCGKCDVCLNEKLASYSTENLTSAILEHLPLSKTQLEKQLNVHSNLLESALRRMILEEMIFENGGVFQKYR